MGTVDAEVELMKKWGPKVRNYIREIKSDVTPSTPEALMPTLMNII